ncbi:MAG TPA: cyclopropane-fatty-acyl-phospholipid synthase family protein [Candidatus Acidoferrales bacterium]|nr:cyclopropane-fatty-acyl-phospholipid synthase family protein [Candidatus Acidoferrales bacterium]
MSTRTGALSLDRWILQKLHEATGRPPIRLRAASGAEVSPADAPPLGEIRIADRTTLARLILDPEIAFGDAYTAGRIEVQGDLVSMLEALSMVMPPIERQNGWAQFVSRWMGWAQADTITGARRNIHRHYDLGNDFYRLWLDPQMSYSCAYFRSPDATLDEAQEAKMEHICRKLRLRPGERVADIGSGWGTLALYMASRYGVHVRGFNISRQQIAAARQRAGEMGLSGRVEFIESDYRDISGPFDAFVSVGMLEHVGRRYLADMGRVIRRIVDKSGRGLLHFIGRNHRQPMSPWIRKRIFPGTYLPTVREVLASLEPGDFSILDVENLRPHYARTLEHWLDRFERSAGLVAREFGEEFVRTWRLYLASAIAGFRTGNLQLFQVLFASAGWRDHPWTRAHLYEPELHAELPARESQLH